MIWFQAPIRLPFDFRCSLFVMVKLVGDPGIAQGWRVRAFFLLGLANLMFNGGHHVYNVPTANWIHLVTYGVSMTEWIFFIAILRGFLARARSTSPARLPDHVPVSVRPEDGSTEQMNDNQKAVQHVDRSPVFSMILINGRSFST